VAAIELDLLDALRAERAAAKELEILEDDEDVIALAMDL